MYNMAPMLVVQFILAESWLQSTVATTSVGVQGTGGRDEGVSFNKAT